MKISKKAFSLIELSIVILIIGIIIAGVTQSSRLVSKFKLSTARNLTASSPVSSIKGLMFWLEPTLESSFVQSETNDQTTITQWKDINPQGGKFNAYSGQRTDNTKFTYNAASGGTSVNTRGPTYIENGLNSIPTLRFTNNGSSAYRYMVIDDTMKSGPIEDLTLFAVITYRSGNDSLIDRQSRLGLPLFGIGVNSDSTLNSIVRSDNTATATVLNSGYTLAANRSYIITTQREYKTSLKMYINGTSSFGGTSTVAYTDGDPITLDPIKIGRHYSTNTGNLDIDISELIFFSGKITTEERQSVEDYLGTKYGLKVTHP